MGFASVQVWLLTIVSGALLVGLEVCFASLARWGRMPSKPGEKTRDRSTTFPKLGKSANCILA